MQDGVGLVRGGGGGGHGDGAQRLSPLQLFCLHRSRATRHSDHRHDGLQPRSVKIDQDLSQKRVGPLALARLYGESCIFMVNNPSPLNWPKRKQICDASL
jgi:hypothetical protein